MGSGHTSRALYEYTVSVGPFKFTPKFTFSSFFGSCVSVIVRIILNNFFNVFRQDCNKNGAADCDDYARIHFNGRDNCTAIEKTNFWKRYEACWPADGKGTRQGFFFHKFKKKKKMKTQKPPHFRRLNKSGLEGDFH